MLGTHAREYWVWFIAPGSADDDCDVWECGSLEDARAFAYLRRDLGGYRWLEIEEFRKPDECIAHRTGWVETIIPAPWETGGDNAF